MTPVIVITAILSVYAFIVSIVLLNRHEKTDFGLGIVLFALSVMVAFLCVIICIKYDDEIIREVKDLNVGNKHTTNNVEYFELDTIRVQGYNPLDSTWYDWRDLKQID